MTDRWQPIETAPRDGTRIDLWAEYVDGGNRSANCFWSRVFKDWVSSDGVRFVVPITHWMLLPGPPDREG